MQEKARKYISLWLFIGIIMVLIQVVLGGITRLTDSGLSITEWELVKGVLPPLNETDWTTAFEKYQTHAKKQYETIHSDMTLNEFKRIYFWEWFHRLWGRTMGIVFIIPFLIFLKNKWFPSWLIKRLIVVIVLTSIVGAFGWIMVASGLDKDNRTWVSAYTLAIHLILATNLFAYLFYTFLKVYYVNTSIEGNVKIKKQSVVLFAIVLAQIILGAYMAGMRAGAIHPHWPFFLGNNHLFSILFNPELITEKEIVNYEGAVWIKGLVQVFHRGVAFILLLLSIFLAYSTRHLSNTLKKAGFIVLLFVLIQYAFGVLTITGIVGNKTPVFLGVVHQGFALILIAGILYTWIHSTKKSNF